MRCPNCDVLLDPETNKCGVCKILYFGLTPQPSAQSLTQPPLITAPSTISQESEVDGG